MAVVGTRADAFLTTVGSDHVLTSPVCELALEHELAGDVGILEHQWCHGFGSGWDPEVDLMRPSRGALQKRHR